MEAQFLFEPRLTERQKIAMAVTFFEPEKPAEHWIRSYAKYLYTGTAGTPVWLKTWADFATELRRKFGDPLDAETTFRKLRALRPTGSARDYAVCFQELAERTQQTEEYKALHFRQFLKVSVRNVLAGKRFTSLNELMDAAIAVDEDLFEGRRFDFVRPGRSLAVTTGPVPMEVDSTTARGPISLEERQRRREQNLCFRCGESGHRAASCTPRRARAENTVRANSITMDFANAPTTNEE